MCSGGEVGGGGASVALMHPRRIWSWQLRSLSWEVARLGGVLLVAWVLEYHPPFPHSSKYWDRDLYYALCLLLFLFGLQVSVCFVEGGLKRALSPADSAAALPPSSFTDVPFLGPRRRPQDVRTIKRPDVLNREQSEEWKGWMQFMFLLYHYYKADEVGNSCARSSNTQSQGEPLLLVCVGIYLAAGVQLNPRHDHVLRLDDWFRQLLLLLHEAGLWSGAL